MVYGEARATRLTDHKIMANHKIKSPLGHRLFIHYFVRKTASCDHLALLNTDLTGSKQKGALRVKPLMPFAIHSSRAWFARALFLYVAFALTAAPAFADGASGVTHIFKPDGTPARAISDYTMLVLAICAAIFVVVADLLVYTVARFRRRAGDDGHEPPQVYGSNQIELAWTVLPILIVFVLSLVTARTIAEVQNATPPPKALQVTVVGHQWWWEIRC